MRACCLESHGKGEIWVRLTPAHPKVARAPGGSTLGRVEGEPGADFTCLGRRSTSIPDSTAEIQAGHISGLVSKRTPRFCNPAVLPELPLKHFNRIPVEILLAIAEHMDDSSLDSWRHASQRLYNIIPTTVSETRRISKSRELATRGRHGMANHQDSGGWDTQSTKTGQLLLPLQSSRRADRFSFLNGSLQNPNERIRHVRHCLVGSDTTRLWQIFPRSKSPCKMSRHR